MDLGFIIIGYEIMSVLRIPLVQKCVLGRFMLRCAHWRGLV